MHIQLNITLLATLMSTLLITSCANTNTSEKNTKTEAVVNADISKVSKKITNKAVTYSLPESALEGYWAVIKPTNEQNKVVGFRKVDNEIKATLYSYTCDADGSYVSSHTYKARLTPSKNAMLMISEGEQEAFSTIKVLKVVSKKAMIINQGFLNAEKSSESAKSMEFVYLYTDKLKPLCAGYDE